MSEEKDKKPACCPTCGSTGSGSGGDPVVGCFLLVLSVFGLWALSCEVTVDGVHYEYRCTTDRGIEFAAEPER